MVEQSCRVAVRDSLHVTCTQSASYQPSHGSSDGEGNFSLDSFMVSLEVENKCQVPHPVQLDKRLGYVTVWEIVV